MTLEKQTVRSGPWQDIFAQGVRVGDTIYLAGQMGVDGDGTVVAIGDTVGQMRQAYDNVRTVLTAFGASMDNVVDETLYVTDMGELFERIDAITALRAQVYGGPPAVTQTLVQVAGLVFPELRIEIKCIARL